MIDLTTIATPFGLLDADTREALKAHGGPYQVWSGINWNTSDHLIGCDNHTYRVKPAPPKPREWWAVETHMFCTFDRALHFINQLNADHPTMNFGPIIHVREVIE